MPRRSEVASQMDLNEIRYAMVWEDHALLEGGLQIEPDDHLLAIMSAGNNVLSLLLREPARITAIDMSPAQVALFELKLAGIRHLSHDEFVTLLGFGPGEDRAAIYDKLRPHLPDDVQTFWAEHQDRIAFGLHRCGRLERYFQGFVDNHLTEVWPDDLVYRMFDAPDLETQAAIFEAEAFTPAFIERFRPYFGRETMERQGRTAAQFAYVEHESVSDYFLERFHWVCTEMRMKGNFYLERFLTATHRDLEAGPEYLRPSNFERLRGLIDRVEIVQAELEQHLDEVEPDTYDGAALSDVFEYMSEDATHDLLAQLARAISPGGRIAYWNLLVPRHAPESMTDQLVPLSAEAERLYANDRSWFYRWFRLEEVVK